MSRTKRPGLAKPLIRLGAAAALGSLSRARLAEADKQAFRALRSRRSETLDRVLPIATDFGSVYAVAGVATSLILLGRPRLAVRATGAALTAWAVAQGAKKVYVRPRPYDDGVIEVLVRRPAGTSYPSGHPAVAAALARVLAPEANKAVGKLIERLPSFVAASRVYVGVHYPSDVIGGRLVGEAVADVWRRYLP
ncbi:MAG TPA: phosphatase PAP2 family protein [Actinomycetota bacterium]|nr:phosphatase PAP2 family protein [Actinomycetota bacterium]